MRPRRKDSARAMEDSARSTTSLESLNEELGEALENYDNTDDDTKKNDDFWLTRRILKRMIKVPDQNKEVNPLNMLLDRICDFTHDVVPLLWKYYANRPPEKSPNRRRPTSEDWKAGIEKIVKKYNEAEGDSGLQLRHLLLAALGLLIVHVNPTVYREIGETKEWKAAVKNKEDKALFANAVEVFERGKSAALKKADEIYMAWKREQMKAQWFDDSLQTAMAKIERELQKKLEFEQFRSTKSSVLPHTEFKCDVKLGEKEENKVDFKCTILFGTQRVRATITWARRQYVRGYEVLHFSIEEKKEDFKKEKTYSLTRQSPLRSTLAGREDYELADTTLVKTAQLYAKEALQAMQAEYGKQRFYSFENTPGFLPKYTPADTRILNRGEDLGKALQPASNAESDAESEESASNTESVGPSSGEPASDTESEESASDTNSEESASDTDFEESASDTDSEEPASEERPQQTLFQRARNYLTGGGAPDDAASDVSTAVTPVADPFALQELAIVRLKRLLEES